MKTLIIAGILTGTLFSAGPALAESASDGDYQVTSPGATHNLVRSTDRNRSMRSGFASSRNSNPHGAHALKRSRAWRNRNRKVTGPSRGDWDALGY